MNDSSTEGQQYISGIHYHPIEFDEPLSMRSGWLENLLEFDIRELNSTNFLSLKRKLLQLAEFARLARIQISFNGLNDYIKNHELVQCCTFAKKYIFHPKRELIELMVEIQTKSRPSTRKYNIDLVF